MDRVSDRKINWRVPPWRVQLECKSYLRFGGEYSSGGKWPLKARQIQEVKDRIELFDCRKSSDSGPRNFGRRTTKALGKSNQVNPASRSINTRRFFFFFSSFLFPFFFRSSLLLSTLLPCFSPIHARLSLSLSLLFLSARFARSFPQPLSSNFLYSHHRFSSGRAIEARESRFD